MSAGDRHGDERAASALADRYHETAAPLVAACAIDDSCDVPWLANRSRNLKTVYRDRHVPRQLKCGIDTDRSLPWHEIPEGQAMDDGLPYDEGTPNAHGDVATPLERREVERQKPHDPDIWKKYTDEMNGYIRAVDDELIKRVPLDMDLRVFAQDDRALLQKIIAAQMAETGDADKRLSMGLQRKFISGAMIADATLGDRQIRVVASDPTVDRVKDVMVPEGCVLDGYKANPIFLANHDPGCPIGNAEVEIKNGRVEALVTFAPAGASAKADEYCALYKAGVLRAVSVGFQPIEYEPIKDGGYRYTKWELMELSGVAVPANANAVTIERAISLRTGAAPSWKSAPRSTCRSTRIRRGTATPRQPACSPIASSTAMPRTSRSPARRSCSTTPPIRS